MINVLIARKIYIHAAQEVQFLRFILKGSRNIFFAFLIKTFQANQSGGCKRTVSLNLQTCRPVRIESKCQRRQRINSKGDFKLRKSMRKSTFFETWHDT